MTARSLALDVLNRCGRSEQYSNLALDAALKRSSLPENERALATALVYGVLERKLTLDYQIALLSSRPFEEISPDVKNLLRLGLYQLAYMERVPDHAAVNETVSLAGKRTGGFVNAILREFLREYHSRGKQIALPDRDSGVAQFLSVRYSVCVPLCERLLASFGEERTESILKAFEDHPALTVRVNTLRTAREELLQGFLRAGRNAVPTGQSKTGIRIPGNAPVRDLPGFSEGLFFVQDEASQLCTEALNAAPGMRVLDTCACPGSKSFGIAMDMQNKGELFSCDLHESKLSLITSGAERLGISILHTAQRDARAPLSDTGFAGETFDRVLCDVPCSGFGVLAKKPELRYKDPAVSDGLPNIQLAILSQSANALKPGGLLVYSTCTILPEENSKNLNRFLADHSNFALLSERTLFPDTDGTDGFFIAVLQKTIPGKL